MSYSQKRIVYYDINIEKLHKKFQIKFASCVVWLLDDDRSNQFAISHCADLTTRGLISLWKYSLSLI